MAILDGHMILHKIDEFKRMRPVAEEEVHALQDGQTVTSYFLSQRLAAHPQAMH